MRILLWHGYLLDGTGSNVYTRALAREWSLAGHDVTVVSQEPAPERYDLGSAAATARPELPGGLLPVTSCSDRYPGGLEGCGCLQGAHGGRAPALHVEANVSALRELRPADLVLVNHVLMGGAVGAELGECPFRVKAHGSELEYSMRGRPELEEWGRRVVLAARREAVYVGSRHIRQVLEEVAGHIGSVVEVPPGVDLAEFIPQAARRGARAGLLDEARRDRPEPRKPGGAAPR